MKLLTFILISFTVAATGGCQIVSIIMDRSTEPTEAAKYVPTKDNLAILVEDYSNPAVLELLDEHMNHLIAEELVANKVAPVVNPSLLTNYKANRGEDFHKINIPAVGKALGAKQLLYVDVKTFKVETANDADIVKGTAEAHIKIVDCTTGQTRWPLDAPSAGYPVSVILPFGADLTEINNKTIRNKLGDALASRVAKLFYEAPSKSSEHPSYPETELR